MKKGDKVPVSIAGDVVAQATVESIDSTANTVTMVFPATRVVMGLRVEIDTAPVATEEPQTQTIITGVDRVNSDGEIIEGKSTGDPAPVAETPVEAPKGPASESAPVVEQVQDNGAVETPTGETTQTTVVEATPSE